MPKIVTRLSNLQVKNAKPKDKEYTLSDGDGLTLRIKPSGAKLWVFNYYQPVTKKREKIGLGSFPTVELSGARELCQAYRAMVANGDDPKIARKSQQAEKQAKQSNTFLFLAERWKAKKQNEIEALTLAKNWRRLEMYIFPTLGTLPVSEFMPKTIIDALQSLQSEKKGDTLKRIVRLVNEVLNFAVNYGAIPFNPCLNVKAVFNFGKGENNPTIRPEELPELLDRLQHSKLTLFTRCLILWQLLTMVRPVEASSARWSEIDFDNAVWIIPPERMKKRKAHAVPLSRQALKILSIMRGFTGDSVYIFQSARASNQPMNSQSANKALRDIGYKGRLTAHGLRAIASTYLNELMINSDVIESCLAHEIKDQVRKAYNRSDYFDQRVTVMQRWGDFVTKCGLV